MAVTFPPPPSLSVKLQLPVEAFFVNTSSAASGVTGQPEEGRCIEQQAMLFTIMVRMAMHPISPEWLVQFVMFIDSPSRRSDKSCHSSMLGSAQVIMSVELRIPVPSCASHIDKRRCWVHPSSLWRERLCMHGPHVPIHVPYRYHGPRSLTCDTIAGGVRLFTGDCCASVTPSRVTRVRRRIIFILRSSTGWHLTNNRHVA